MNKVTIKTMFEVIYEPEYSMTSSGDLPSTSRAILSMSSLPYFSLALTNWLKSRLVQFVNPCEKIKYHQSRLN